ncbi:NAD(P)-dependent oxidoreductase [Candidatus Woesearchaeota archaeon]|nr:NAD(P)-dependent oxidoreductase [Candidatus Woesearchaeota archaeon]
MKILITGISSNLGTLIARKLSQHHKIIGISTRNFCEFKTINFDLGSNKDLDIEPVNLCIHLAFITDPDLCEKDARAYKVNIMGTKKILDYCKNKKINKFVLASTGSVYGFSDKILKESIKPYPYNAYSSMKYQAEEMAKKYRNYFDVLILRYFFPYGPGTKKNSLINNLIYNVANRKKIILHEGSKPIINPIYITDAVKATNLLCLKKFKDINIINVAGPESASIKEITQMIASILGKEPLFQPSNEVFKDMVASIEKLSKYYKPRMTLKEGLKMTIKNLKIE